MYTERGGTPSALSNTLELVNLAPDNIVVLSALSPTWETRDLSSMWDVGWH